MVVVTFVQAGALKITLVALPKVKILLVVESPAEDPRVNVVIPALHRHVIELRESHAVEETVRLVEVAA